VERGDVARLAGIAIEVVELRAPEVELPRSGANRLELVAAKEE
jgi:hypothetical protein